MKKPCRIGTNALRAQRTSANDHQVDANIPRKKPNIFSPIQHLCNKRRLKLKSSFTLMMLIHDSFGAVFGCFSANNNRKVAKAGTPTNFDVVILIFLF